PESRLPGWGLLQPPPKNVATFVATFCEKNVGKTVFVATLQPPEGIGIPRPSSSLQTSLIPHLPLTFQTKNLPVPPRNQTTMNSDVPTKQQPNQGNSQNLTTCSELHPSPPISNPLKV